MFGPGERQLQPADDSWFSAPILNQGVSTSAIGNKKPQWDQFKAQPEGSRGGGVEGGLDNGITTLVPVARERQAASNNGGKQQPAGRQGEPRVFGDGQRVLESVDSSWLS